MGKNFAIEILQNLFYGENFLIEIKPFSVHTLIKKKTPMWVPPPLIANTSLCTLT